MDLEKITKDACYHIAQFRELLVQIGQKKGEGDIWEIVQMQRKQTLDNCRKACSNLIAKKPTCSVEDINGQLELLHLCVDWLLDEMEKSKRLLQNLQKQLSQEDLILIDADIKESTNLLKEIRSHKTKVQMNFPTVPQIDTGIEVRELSVKSSSAQIRNHKRKQNKCRPTTKFYFSQQL